MSQKSLQSYLDLTVRYLEMFKLAIEPHILRNHKYDRFSTYYFLSSTTASHRLNLQGTHQLFKIVKPARNRASAFLTWTQKFHTSHQKYLSSAVLAGLFGNDQYVKRSGCEDLDRTSKGITQVYHSATSTAISSMSRAKLKKLRRNAKRVIRMVMRAVQIMLNLAPLLIIYPLQKLLGTNDEVDVPCRGEHDKVSTADVFMKWYLRMCLRNIESCGATVVKIMQVSEVSFFIIGRFIWITIRFAILLFGICVTIILTDIHS